MVDTNYRLSKNRDEIIKVLKDKFKANSIFIIWQKNPETNERNFIIEANFHSIDSIESTIAVNIKNEDIKKLDPNLETFFLLKGEDFAFKTKLHKNYFTSKEVTLFQTPKEIRLIEYRVSPRVYFEEDEVRRVNVIFNSKTPNSLVESACRIFNISNSGICIIITKETLSEINLQKKIILEGLGFFGPIGNTKKAIVRNARVFKKKTIKSDETFAIGLEFQS